MTTHSQTLETWLDAEFSLMRWSCGWLFQQSFILNQGNPGGQIVHDGGTCDNQVKYQGKYYEKLEQSGDCGHLPRMARCYVGANLSEGFCERMLSVANQVMSTGNTLLSSEHLKKLVILRMNRDFMEYMRAEQRQVLIEMSKNVPGNIMIGPNTLVGVRAPATKKKKPAAKKSREENPEAVAPARRRRRTRSVRVAGLRMGLRMGWLAGCWFCGWVRSRGTSRNALGLGLGWFRSCALGLSGPVLHKSLNHERWQHYVAWPRVD